MGEAQLFKHSFMGSTHSQLSFWVRQYEAYDIMKNRMDTYNLLKDTKIFRYLKTYLGEEWKEQLSSYYENQQALSHYYKCLETHNEGKSYYDMMDSMSYLKDDYNDRADHFNIAEERHNMLKDEFKEEIKKLKKNYEESKLYKMENYFDSTNAIGTLSASDKGAMNNEVEN